MVWRGLGCELEKNQEKPGRSLYSEAKISQILKESWNEISFKEQKLQRQKNMQIS